MNNGSEQRFISVKFINAKVIWLFTELRIVPLLLTLVKPVKVLLFLYFKCRVRIGRVSQYSYV